MDIANILLIGIDIVYIAGIVAIWSAVTFVIIRSSIISAVKELRKQNIL